MAQQSNVYRPKTTGFLIAAILLVMLVVLVLVSTILIVFAGRSDGGVTTTAGEDDDHPAVTTKAPSKTTTVTTTKPEDPEIIKPGYIELDRSKMNEGTLLLIDPDHLNLRSGLVDRKNMTADQLNALGFVQIPGDTGYFSRKDYSLYLDREAYTAFEAMTKDLSAAVGSNLQVRNAYYYKEGFAEMRVDENGNPNIDDLEMMEHSTGMVLDLQISVNNAQYSLTHQSQQNYYNWLKDNCYQYGYIWVRDITNKYSTFRYVGIPHAAAMRKLAVDLPDYISALSPYTFQSHLTVSDAGGNEWWIYYVKAEQAITKVAVIGEENCYMISGDNDSGFVIALNSTLFSK
ncbi:MAG: hypothetical protein IJ955_05310 [Oscillospiraceae bacterium]|nr:hypothetical protein [Oscillospiraceae bacterium]